eukprot:CAMPEP_0196587186 /NCGR_PEP_ID=MMETSP1081-20130531/56685_1 /TAXON_ID=36882 /ORGANISM="Pyramimonas amylifera, Strain CCMP720" /LENGTH=296 /DNA_ID=CAMNT_0041909293 /DNA_START=46 /DNA_END=936 /DNA_ORIENTATION=-
MNSWVFVSSPNFSIKTKNVYRRTSQRDVWPFVQVSKGLTRLRETCFKVSNTGIENVESKSVPSHPLLPRRAALLLATLPLSVPLTPGAGALPEDLQVFEEINGERFAPLQATFQLPSGWTGRPGQRAKPGKFLLYTDTYGPNYRYFSVWPKLRDGEGQAVDSIEVTMSGRAGLESIADLGPQSGLEPQRGFGVSRGDLVEGGNVDLKASSQRRDTRGQLYYQWELLTSEGNTVLVSAAGSGGGLYVLALGATPEQWTRNAESMRMLQSSFVVPPSQESSIDISGRIYGQRKEGGFK